MIIEKGISARGEMWAVVRPTGKPTGGIRISRSLKCLSSELGPVKIDCYPTQMLTGEKLINFMAALSQANEIAKEMKFGQFEQVLKPS